LRAGAQIAYSPEEVIGRAELLAKIGRPTGAELNWCAPGMALLAFYHMAVADKGLVDMLAERCLTAIGCEVIQQEDGRLPVLAAISEIAGQMTVPIAAHLLRSSSGGRGILLGGTPGVPPARVVVLGAGAAGFAAARTAARSGARVMAFDRDPGKLLHIMEHADAVETCLADEDAIAEAVAGADVVIGAILVAGKRPPHVVTRAMVEQMKKGSAVIDVAIDQGGCVETSRPTTIAEPTFVYKGVTHFCVPNFTADLGRSASVAIAQAMLPYVLTIAKHGVEGAIERCSELARGVYTLRGRRP
jgi:alanine dehydrogenase